MKTLVLIFLILIIGCSVTTGCVGVLKKAGVNTTITPANTPAQTSTVTFIPTISPIAPVTTTPGSGLKGLLRISIGGWDAALPVSVDNASVGTVTRDNPLYLKVEEGNHTVQVCESLICEQQTVTVQFAKQNVVDFEQQLTQDVGFPQPTSRIIGWYPSSGKVTVSVEMINPSNKTLYMATTVNLAYTSIESDSHNRVGNLAEGVATANVPSGGRVTQDLSLYLVSGYSYEYSIPLISSSTSR